MQYEFPEIQHLDEVRAVVENLPEFVIAERDWGYVVNYLVMTPETFPPVFTAGGSAQMREAATRAKAIRRECRGLIFCPKTLRITRRPLTKFFNINERDETQIDKLDFSLPHRVYTKLDGSMLVPFEVEYGSGIVRWGTKMGCGTSVAMAAECFVADNPRYQQFAEWCIQQDISPIFEFTSPGDYKIVVDYNKPMMTLLAARHMITGEYQQLDGNGTFAVQVQNYDIPVVGSFDPVTDPVTFMQNIKRLEGSEGVVIAWDNGMRVKGKSDWYVLRHRAKDAVGREKDVVAMLVEEKLDDIKGMLDPNDRHRLEQFERDFWQGVDQVASVWKMTNSIIHKEYGNDRKAFALSKSADSIYKTGADDIGPHLKSAVFRAWDQDWGHAEWRQAVIDVISKNTGTATKIDTVRALFGGARWSMVVNTGDE